MQHTFVKCLKAPQNENASTDLQEISAWHAYEYRKSTVDSAAHVHAPVTPIKNAITLASFIYFICNCLNNIPISITLILQAFRTAHASRQACHHVQQTSQGNTKRYDIMHQLMQDTCIAKATPRDILAAGHRHPPLERVGEDGAGSMVDLAIFHL